MSADDEGLPFLENDFEASRQISDRELFDVPPFQPDQEVVSFFDDYEVLNGVPTRVLKPSDEASQFSCHAFTRDASRMVTGETNGTIRIWEASAYKLVAEARGLFDNVIDCITFVGNRSDTIRAVDGKGHFKEIWISMSSSFVGPSATADATETAAVEVLRDQDMRISGDTDNRRYARVNQFSKDGNKLLCASWMVDAENAIRIFEFQPTTITCFTPKLESTGYRFPSLSPLGTSLIVCSVRRDAFDDVLEDEAMPEGKSRLFVWPKIDMSKSGDEGFEIKGLYATWGLGGRYLLVYSPLSSSGNRNSGSSNTRQRSLKLAVYATRRVRRSGLRSCLGEIRLESELKDIRAQVLKPHENGENLRVLIHAVSTAGKSRLLIWDVTDNEVLREVAVELPPFRGIDLDRWKFRGVSASKIFECGCCADRLESFFCRIMEDRLPKFSTSLDAFWAGVYSCRQQSCAIVSMRSEATAWNFTLPKEWEMDPFKMWNQTEFDPCGKHFLVFGDSVILACAPSFLPGSSGKFETWSWERHKTSHAWHNEDNPAVMLSFSDKTRKTAADVFHGFSSEALANALSARTAAVIPGSESIESVLCKYPGDRRIADAALSPDGQTLAFIVSIEGRGNVVHSLELARHCSQTKETIAPPYKICEEGFVPARVFLYENYTNSEESMVLLPVGYKPVALFCNMITYATTKFELPVKKCLRVSQAEVHRILLLLDTQSVCIFDLPQREMLRRVEYAADLGKLIRLAGRSRKWYRPKLSHRDKNAERRISDDGEAVLLGWDTKNDKPVLVSPAMDQSTCEEAIATSENSLLDFCVMARNGKYVTFIDYNDLSSQEVMIGIYSLKREAVMYRVDATPEVPREQLSHDQLLGALSRVFHDLSSNGTELILARTGLDMDKSIADIDEDRVRRVNVYNSADCLPGYKELILKNPENPESQIEEVFERYGTSVFNAPDSSGKTILQHAFLKSHTEVVNAIVALAEKHDFQLAMEFYPRDEPAGNLLQNALERKATNDVREAFMMITSNVVPFGSAAHILKHSFRDLLAGHRHLVDHALANNLLSREICQMKVHVNFLNSRIAQDESAHIQTSDTMLEWRHNSDPDILATTWRDRNNTVVSEFESSGDVSESPALLRIFCIQDSTRFGMHGILRHLLMHNVPEYFFTYPAVAAIIQFKWHNLWRHEIMKDFLFYLVNLALVIAYMLLLVGVAEDDFSEWTKTTIALPILLVVMFAMGCNTLVDEIHQVQSFVRDGIDTFGSWKWGILYYFKSLWNSLDFALCFLILGPIPLLHVLSYAHKYARSLLSIAIAIEAILMSIKAWYFAQAFRRTGALVSMIAHIYVDSLPFLSLAVVILIGFGLALHILLHDKNAKAEPGAVSISYGNFGKSVLTLFYAVLGEFDSELYFPSSEFHVLITLTFVMFMITEMIVFLNLLIALMGDTFDRIKHSEEAQVLLGRAQIMDACEAALRESSRVALEKKAINKYIHTLERAEADETEKDTTGKWMGKMKEFERTMRDHVGRMVSAFSDQSAKNEAELKEWMERTSQEHETNLANRIESVTERQESSSAALDARVSEIAQETEQLGSAIAELKQETASQFDRLASLLENLRNA